MRTSAAIFECIGFDGKCVGVPVGLQIDVSHESLITEQFRYHAKSYRVLYHTALFRVTAVDLAVTVQYFTMKR